MSPYGFAAVMLFFMAVPLFIVAGDATEGSTKRKVFFLAALVFSAPAVLGLWLLVLLGG